MPSKVRKAVFPVGGMGTRFLPATKATPKEMLSVVDKPLIQYAVEEAMAAGIEEFIFVTGRGKTAIEDHFDHSAELEALLEARGKNDQSTGMLRLPPGAVAYTRQQEPLGLGHAVWCARHLVGEEPFAVLLADELVMAETPCMAQLVALYERVGGCVFALSDVPREQTDRYGIVDIARDDGEVIEIKGMVEKPAPASAPSTASIIGRYILQPSVFVELDKQEKGIGGEIQLTDSLARLLGTTPFHGLRFKGQRFDCGSKPGFLKASIAYAMQRPELRDELKPFLSELLRLP